MPIIRDGVDVTEEVRGYVGRNAARERERERQLRPRGRWYSAIRHLIDAQAHLGCTPRPWQNACVSESIEKIEAVIKALRGET